MLKIINLFAGHGTWTKPWVERGHEVWSTDIRTDVNVDLSVDILDLRLSDIPEEFKNADVILASPDCTAFSVASMGKHWGGGKNAYIPKTPKARNRIALIHQTAAIIEAIQPKVAIIENPRGVLRKLKILDRYERVTVTYCQYGDTRMKPTDLWGAPFPEGWQAKDMCRNGDPCHERAPRGERFSGTQGLPKDERSFIPYGLSLSLCLATEEMLLPKNK